MDRQFKSKFLRGSAFSVTGTLLMIVCHFVSLKVLAEYMPLEDFGIFALLMVINHGFEVVSGLGFSLTLVKNMSGDVDSQHQQQVVTVVVLARSIQLVLLSVLVIALGQWILPRFFGATIAEFIVFLPAMFCLGSFRELLFRVLQGRQRFRWHATIKVLSAVTRLSAILLLNHFGRLGVGELVWVEIITSAATVIMLLLSTSVASLLRFATVRLVALKRLLGFSAPLYANDLFTYFYEGVTVLLLGALLAPSSVALYAIATKIPDALGRVLQSLLVVYFPSMSELMGSGRRDEGQRLMNLALVLISVGLSLIALITFFFKEEIVLILFSEQYIKAAPVLALLMLSFILSCMARLMGSTAVAAGHSSVPVRINVITSVINALACLVLIPRWGVLGAVSCQIAVNATAQYLYWYYLNRARLVIQVRDIATPIVLGLVLVALYELSGREHLTVRAALIVLYSGLCWLLIPGVRRCSE